MQSCFAEPCGAYANLSWKPGVELPPFFLANSAAVELCQSILAGRVAELPHVIVSEAVAIQVYRMCTSARRA